MSSMIPATHAFVVLASAWTTVGVVLLWIVAVLAGLLALIVLVPAHLWAAGGVDDLNMEGQARIRWAWGVLSVRLTPDRTATIHLFGLRIWSLHSGGKKDDPEPKPKKRPAKGWPQWLLRHRQTGLRFLKRLLGTLQLRLRLQGELGLGDPATTALMSRLLLDLSRVSPAVSVQVEPDWLEERVQLAGELRARIWLAHIGLVLLAGILNRETIQMIRTAPRRR